MPTTVYPDVEALIGGYLDPQIAAFDARAVSTLSGDVSRPVVKITQLGAVNSDGSPVEHLLRYDLQFDCYAGTTGGRIEAHNLSRAVRSALKAAQNQVVNGQVVTHVVFVGDARIPDEAFTPWRERYVLTATIRMHPA